MKRKNKKQLDDSGVWVTSEQAAQMIGRSETTLRSWRSRGMKNQPRWNSRIKKYKRSDVLAWIEKNAVEY